MGMPVIASGTGSRFQAVTDIVTSVALEQTALSHILNAEGEKIQKIVACSKSAEEMLEVNRSVEAVVREIASLETILYNKLGLLQACFCKDEEETA